MSTPPGEFRRSSSAGPPHKVPARGLVAIKGSYPPHYQIGGALLMKRHVVPIAVRLRSLTANSGRGRRARRGLVLAVALSCAVFGLVTAAPVSVPPAAADSQTGDSIRCAWHRTARRIRCRVAPYPETYKVRVAPYSESYKVRVAPYSETYQQRVAPYTRTVAAYNYETVCIWLGCYQQRVAPYTRTVAAYNYETRTRAVYNYETRTRAVYNYETRTQCRLQLRDKNPCCLQLRDKNPQRLPHPHLSCKASIEMAMTHATPTTRVPRATS